MNKKKIIELCLKFVLYSIIYILINLYMTSKDTFDFQNWYYMGNIASASIVYLIIMLGSDSISYRISDESPLKEKLDKLTITKMGLITHVVLIVIGLAGGLIMERM